MNVKKVMLYDKVRTKDGREAFVVYIHRDSYLLEFEDKSNDNDEDDIEFYHREDFDVVV